MAAALAYGTIAQGAFYAPQAITLAVLVVAAVFGRSLIDEYRSLHKAMKAASGLLGLALVVALIANPTTSASGIVAHCVVAGAGFLAGRMVVRYGVVDELLSLLSAAGTAAAGLGILGAALHLEPLALQAQGIWRAASTLTYANSLGAFLVPAAAAAVYRISKGKPSAQIELAWIFGGLLASMSRGAGAGLVVGFVIAMLAGWRPTDGRMWRGLAGGVIIGAGAVPAILGSPALLPAIVGAVSGTALATGRFALPGRMKISASGALAAIVIAGGAMVAVAPNAPGELVERAVNEDRLSIWGAVYETGSKGPLFGTGLGNFTVYQERYGRIFSIRYAHNETLQALVEAGYPGAISLLAVAALAAWGIAARRRRDLLGSLGVGVAAMFWVHGQLDFMWHIPVFVLAASLWAGMAASNDIKPRLDLDKFGAVSQQ